MTGFPAFQPMILVVPVPFPETAAPSGGGSMKLVRLVCTAAIVLGLSGWATAFACKDKQAANASASCSAAASAQCAHAKASKAAAASSECPYHQGAAAAMASEEGGCSHHATAVTA